MMITPLFKPQSCIQMFINSMHQTMYTIFSNISFFTIFTSSAFASLPFTSRTSIGIGSIIDCCLRSYNLFLTDSSRVCICLRSLVISKSLSIKSIYHIINIKFDTAYKFKCNFFFNLQERESKTMAKRPKYTI
jgi:hypothetical protein